MAMTPTPMTDKVMVRSFMILSCHGPTVLLSPVVSFVTKQGQFSRHHFIAYVVDGAKKVTEFLKREQGCSPTDKSNGARFHNLL